MRIPKMLKSVGTGVSGADSIVQHLIYSTNTESITEEVWAEARGPKN